MIRYLLYLCFTYCALCPLHAEGVKALERATWGLIPYPREVSLLEGELRLYKNFRLYSDVPDFAFPLEYLRGALSAYSLQTDLEPSSPVVQISLLYNADIKGDESYRLTVQTDGIRIEASHRQGALYAVVTLSQLLDSHYDSRMERFSPLECLRIDDSPRYALRALMLDPARHFLPVEDVKSYIDQMLRYKFNTLQLHLTDDQGWRIEIKRHPRLTQINAERPVDRLWVGQSRESAQRAAQGYYTQSDMRALIDYATERGIKIIPEIDVPGHTAALLKAYPDLRVSAHRDSVFVLGKTDKVMLSAVSADTYRILQDVFVELAEIFPRGTYLHLGGDESAIAENWAKDGAHLSLMQKLGYRSPEGLMAYFFDRVYAMVRPLGLRLMQWCELDNIRLPASRYMMPYPKDVALVTWRMGLSPKCLELTRRSGHQLILAPGESAYLDYPQAPYDLPEHNNWGMPITSLARSYAFDLDAGIDPSVDQYVMGVMATLWGEAIPHIGRAFYMTYPRALAIAEQGWTPYHLRSWERFRRYLPCALDRLEREGIPHRRPVEVYRSYREHRIVGVR